MNIQKSGEPSPGFFMSPQCGDTVKWRGSDPQRGEAGKWGLLHGKFHLKLLFIPTQSRGY